ncbi:hypothetical protein A1F97_01688 [Pyrenophora tritici-repentis]|nr:hypothetical protein A1F97_01688 [Pyrenophora tritici-repentis]
MARTRACKGRPRLPGRVIRTEKEENVRRGSTVEELMLSDNGNEDERDIGHGVRCSVETKRNEDNVHHVNVEIKKEKEDEEMIKVDRDEKEEEDTTLKPQQPRKRPRTRTHDEQQTSSTPLLPSPFASPSFLRPYLSFQLSLSNLSGERYRKAEKSMKVVLDAVSSLKTSTGTRKQRKSKDDKREVEGKGRTKPEERDDDVLPRKQRELNEQTTRRLLAEAKEGEEGKKRVRVTKTVRRHTDSISSSSSESTHPTPHTPPTHPRHSASSLSSGYTPQRTSSLTDSAASVSSAEESDVIERQERNGLRRRKRAMKKKLYMRNRGEEVKHVKHVKRRLNRGEEEEKQVKKEKRAMQKQKQKMMRLEEALATKINTLGTEILSMDGWKAANKINVAPSQLPLAIHMLRLSSVRIERKRGALGEWLVIAISNALELVPLEYAHPPLALVSVNGTSSPEQRSIAIGYVKS